jgi:polyisoprenoid-binding protein YceI
MRRNYSTLKHALRLTVLCFVASSVFPFLTSAQDVPIFKISEPDSSISFSVKASVALEGTFETWDSTLVFTSPDVTTGVLTVNIQADSVNTGSGMKDGKLKSKDFFDVKEDPTITFVSNKIIQTGPDSFEIDGIFTIRGVSNPEKLTLTVSGKGTGTGVITGTMVFDRKDYGMNSGIPFIKIADHVEVSFSLKGVRVSGPALTFSE